MEINDPKEEDMICNVGLSPGGKDIISPLFSVGLLPLLQLIINILYLL